MRPLTVLLSTTPLSRRPRLRAEQRARPAGPADQPDPRHHRRLHDAGRADDTVQDIVVTAQGRAQALADVPVAVSAITAETLQNSGANDIRQLNQVAPSLLVSSTGSEANGSARIRGIGTVGDNPGLESSVAVFIDGVYRSRSGIGLNELGEIDRVEVLRGPQGTLGGRNSSAGLITSSARRPRSTASARAAKRPMAITTSCALPGTSTCRSARRSPRGSTASSSSATASTTIRPTTPTSTTATAISCAASSRSSRPATSPFRLIADYTHRNEKCCAAIYVDRSVNPAIGELNEPVASVNAGVGAFGSGNNIVNVLTALGQPLARVNRPGYDRTISASPGRSFAGKTEDYGFSGQIDWDLGGAKLTSITAYRDYQSDQGSDTDYSTVDILYRAADGNSSRQFKTFTQELRLQGTLFNDKLDWLIGGFYADEKLRVTDNLRFGNQYGRFATCRAVSGGDAGVLLFADQPGLPRARGSRRAAGRAFAAAGIAATRRALVAAFDRLDSVNDKGSTLDIYNQNSRNYAFFTHNIIHVLDNVDLTLGALH